MRVELEILSEIAELRREIATWKAELAKKDAEIAHLQQDCQTEAATVIMLTAERDNLAEDLYYERQRGLALLADAKEWQAQLAKVEADFLAAKVTLLRETCDKFSEAEILMKENHG
jgi:chromosome segregation ATPase